MKKDIEKEKLISLLEKLFPTVREHLVVAELGTPKTMERYTRNEKGALYGFSQTKAQTMFFRMKQRGPLKNLSFASSWTLPGGGYEGSIRSADWLVNRASKSGMLITAFLVLFMMFGWMLFL